ncbi:hypothetical protein ACOSP7_026303 [Xanthoceras sorbifolium]
MLAYVLLLFLLVRRGLCSSGFLDPSSQQLLSLPLHGGLCMGLVWDLLSCWFFLLRPFDSSDRSCWCAWIWGGSFLLVEVDVLDVQYVDGALPYLEVEWCCDGCCGGGLNQGLDRPIWAVRGLGVLEVLRLYMGIAALFIGRSKLAVCDFSGSGVFLALLWEPLCGSGSVY